MHLPSPSKVSEPLSGGDSHRLPVGACSCSPSRSVAVCVPVGAVVYQTRFTSYGQTAASRKFHERSGSPSAMRRLLHAPRNCAFASGPTTGPQNSNLSESSEGSALPKSAPSTSAANCSSCSSSSRSSSFAIGRGRAESSAAVGSARPNGRSSGASTMPVGRVSSVGSG